jgi:hypothetical protein
MERADESLAFTPAQKLEFQQMVQNAIQKALNAQAIQNTRHTAPTQPPLTLARQLLLNSRMPQLQSNGGQMGPKMEPWNGEELGYFHPDLADQNDAAVVVLDNKVHYRDVHVFTARVREVAAVKGEDTIKHQLWVCLRGAALSWYSVELSEHQRQWLRLTTLEDGWIRSLVGQFKLMKEDAEEKLKRLCLYSMADVRAGASIRVFAHRVLRYATAMGIDSIPDRLYQVWIKLAPELQVHIPRPTATLTTVEFLNQLSSKEQRTWQKTAVNVPGLSLTQADSLPASLPGKFESIPKLKGWHDYDNWEFLVRSQLYQYSMSDLISPELRRPTEMHRKYATWVKLSRMVSSWILLQLDMEIVSDLLASDEEIQYADEAMDWIRRVVFDDGQNPRDGV